MNWEKRGLIFDPYEHALPVGGAGFAQSPQSLILHDRVRVYFSTRERDEFGKYLSHVAYVDFDRQMHRVIGVSHRPVIGLGATGCFDEHGIFPFSVFHDGERILAYTTGWNRKVSVSADASIGLAISHDDGETFQRYGNGPVMTACLNEPFLVCDAFVMREGDTYRMWYIFGCRWVTGSASEQPDRVYKIAYAESRDGIYWRRNGKPLIADRLHADECQALPTVIRLGDTYHMYFCYRDVHGFRTDSGKAYRIGYAYSGNGLAWTRDDDKGGIDVSADGWDSGMQCYPHIFECDGKVHLLYNGNEFGRHGFGLATLVEA